MVVELCEADKIMYKEGALENAPLATPPSTSPTPPLKRGGILARSPKDK